MYYKKNKSTVSMMSNWGYSNRPILFVPLLHKSDVCLFRVLLLKNLSNKKASIVKKNGYCLSLYLKLKWAISIITIILNKSITISVSDSESASSITREAFLSWLVGYRVSKIKCHLTFYNVPLQCQISMWLIRKVKVSWNNVTEMHQQMNMQCFFSLYECMSLNECVSMYTKLG